MCTHLLARRRRAAEQGEAYKAGTAIDWAAGFRKEWDMSEAGAQVRRALLHGPACLVTQVDLSGDGTTR